MDPEDDATTNQAETLETEEILDPEAPSDDREFEDAELGEADEEEDDEEDVDEDADLPPATRQMRAVLRAEGYTFDAEGNPVAPVKEAVGVETPAAEVEAEVTPPAAPVEVAPFEFPTEHHGFPVRADGLDLFDPAFEDPEGDEATDLIDGVVDDEGNLIKEGIGERGYIVRAQQYAAAKASYGQELDSKLTEAVQSRQPAFVAEVDESNKRVKEWLAPLGESGVDTLLSEYVPKTTAILAEYQRERVAALGAQGVSSRRALLIANREIVETPNVYQMALGQAVVENLGGFIPAALQHITDSVIGKLVAGLGIDETAARAVLSAPKSEAAKTPPAKTTTAPPRPPVPSVSRGGSGGGVPPTTPAAVKPTDGERRMAIQRGKRTEAEIVEYARKSRQYA